MDVKLLNYTPNPQAAIASAARLCYAAVGAAELMETMSDEAQEKVLMTILKGGHFSALEHASYTFAIEGVSRAMTHQLVRHRMASYNQQSQRYVKFDEAPEFIIPQSVIDAGKEEEYTKATTDAFNAYSELAQAGVPAEDARYLLPNACETKIVVTMNVRELHHFFSLRCCSRAQWEIRAVANRMLELVRPTAPLLFKQAGPGCVKGCCPEGKMSCGNPWAKIEI
ncbi:MAG: FAD-dependent thymidylate synthase [Coriobacteriales bacterium]|nr:FAD-dependent thymidylate synthase [Coriobacteriales bacterium]